MHCAKDRAAHSRNVSVDEFRTAQTDLPHYFLERRGPCCDNTCGRFLVLSRSCHDRTCVTESEGVLVPFSIESHAFRAVLGCHKAKPLEKPNPTRSGQMPPQSAASVFEQKTTQVHHSR